ncbi:hypothetical protein NDU88_011770 [Pleurodeles waltl]|uniref:Uncharacterized protein n=1 Tax=Pleurodeles waltl TaxID=8319 RepID=A0AAV7QYA5_PLEWA|nr:hypothetical protein NDU88_011770 [Pleurodeles waltl]
MLTSGIPQKPPGAPRSGAEWLPRSRGPPTRLRPRLPSEPGARVPERQGGSVIWKAPRTERLDTGGRSE